MVDLGGFAYPAHKINRVEANPRFRQCTGELSVGVKSRLHSLRGKRPCPMVNECNRLITTVVTQMLDLTSTERECGNQTWSSS
jgi:hypothetical protein